MKFRTSLILLSLLPALLISCGYDSPAIKPEHETQPQPQPQPEKDGWTISDMSVAPEISNEVPEEEGVVINGLVWQSANMGVGKSGSLYQWGGQADSFIAVSSDPFDWQSPQNDHIWEQNPPCPEGWRLPTKEELRALCVNYSEWTACNGQEGRWFSGSVPYSDGVSAVFFPAAGACDYYDGSVRGSGEEGWYWSASSDDTYAVALYFHDEKVYIGSYFRARSMSVRCCRSASLEIM